MIIRPEISWLHITARYHALEEQQVLLRVGRGNGQVLRVVEDEEGKGKRMIELRHN